MKTRILLSAAVLFLAWVSPARSQDETPTTVTVQNRSGDLPFSTSIGTDIEHVDVASGNLIVHIPLTSVKGRGMDFNFGLNYDARFWITGTRQLAHQAPTQLWNIGLGNYIPDATTGFGWQPNQGRLTWTNERSSCGLGPTALQYFHDHYIYHDLQGGNHALAVMGAYGLCDDGGFQPVWSQGPDWSGAGLYASMPGWESTPSVYQADGTQVAWPMGAGPAPPNNYVRIYLGEQAVLGAFTDTNGNTLQQYPGGLDTLGRTVVTQQNGTNQILYKIYDSSGTQQTYTVNYSSIALSTSFNVTGDYGPIQEYTGSRNIITSIVLPNGHTYSFQYETGGFGGLSRIDLPTGAYITYTWGTINSGVRGDHAFRYVTSRTVHTDGQTFTWNISMSCTTVSGGVDCTTTVTDPLNEQSVYGNHNGAITTAKIYSGSATGTPLRQYAITYNSYPDMYSEGEGYLQMPTVITTTLEDGSTMTKKEFDYDTVNYSWPECSDVPNGNSGCLFDPNTNNVIMENESTSRGNVIEMREFDRGQGAPGPLLRRTKNAYLHDSNSNYLNANIVDKIVKQTICNGTVACAGNGDQAAQTLYDYDNYTSGSGLQSATNAAEHDDTGHGTNFTLRGNLTHLNRWRNTDGALLTTAYSYDTLGNIRAITDPLSHTTSYDYTDSFANTACPPPSGKTGQAWVSTVTNPLSQQIKVTRYPCTSLVQAHKDQNDINAGRSGTTYAYDLLGRTTAKNLPDGGQVATSYNDVPPISVTSTTKITSALSLVSATIKDGLGRAKQTQLTSDEQGTVFVDTTYDALGRKSTVSNPYRSAASPTDGTTTYFYDALGRACVVVPPDGTLPAGNTCPATQPANTVFTAYSGNSTTVTDQAGKSRESIADGLGRLIQVFEDPGSSPHLNYETDYTYDALDNLLTVNQKGGDSNSANWRTRAFAYDSLSRLLCAANPEIQIATCPTPDNGTYTNGTVRYSYDNAGNVLTKKSPKPNQTSNSVTVTATFGYDALNRITSKSFDNGDPTINYTYDGVVPTGWPTACSPGSFSFGSAVGKRTAMCDAAGMELWGYSITSGVGWLTIDQRTTNSVTKTTAYQNNFAGSVASLTYPSGRIITYTPDGANRTSKAIDVPNSINYVTGTCANGTDYLGVCYTPPGSPSSFLNGVNLASTFYYNSRLQPCRMSTKSSGTVPGSCTDTTNIGNVLDFSYSFSLRSSDNGNVAGITNNRDTTRSQVFTYDSLNRIATAETTSTYASSPSHCWGEAYFYDNLTTAGGGWGNLTKIVSPSSAYTGCTGESLSVTALSNNQLSGLSYDAAGNLLNDGASSYVFDGENRITTGAGVAYKYDGDGKRVQKSSGRLYWYGTGSDSLDETDLSGNTNNSSFFEYIYFGSNRIARRDYQNNVNYYFSDHLGTARIVANSSGSVLDDSDFYPFGGERVVASSSGNRYKFTGKERDAESNLDNFGARYDSSSLGRFMSPDILGGHQEDPQTLNRYVYARNNPLNLTDPTGLDFNLTCSGPDTATCHGGLQGTTTTTTDANGNQTSTFTATVISNDKNGDLVDQNGNYYNATIGGGGVSFSQDGSNQPGSLGVFINGTNPTTIQGTGDLTGFNFTFTYSNMKSDVTAGGTWTFNGSYEQAEDALGRSGYKSYFLDIFDPYHPSGLDYDTAEFRSPGQKGTGANSGHFTVHEPVIQFDRWRIPLWGTAPTRGDVHLGEHNPYTGGAGEHLREVRDNPN